MKVTLRRFACMLIMLCLLMPSAMAVKQEQPIPDFCKPILEAWNATNEGELQQAVLKYWEENQPTDWSHLHYGYKKPVSFQFGGTTEEVISSHKDWDVAIVSSKDVALQMLANAGVIISEKYSVTPATFQALEQWTYPKAVQEMLPQDPLRYYYVFCYSYEAATNEAIFLICNEKDRPEIFWHRHWAKQIIEHRSADEIRALEGLCRKIDWDNFGMPELSDTEEDLVAHPEDWDWAFLRIDKEDKLEKLDEAGLLYSFSQDEYWKNRSPQWEEPAAIWSIDGSRMIAIPYHEWNYNAENEISVFVVNAKSPALTRALEYAEHYIKSYEWVEYGRNTYYSDTNEMKKYFKDYQPGDRAIFKKDVNW